MAGKSLWVSWWIIILASKLATDLCVVETQIKLGKIKISWVKYTNSIKGRYIPDYLAYLMSLTNLVPPRRKEKNLEDG